MSSAEIASLPENNGNIPPYRYDRAAQARVALNRVPFYWSRIETSNGYSDYRWQDATVAQDAARGLQINAILMNTPAWGTTASVATGTQVAPPPRLGQKQLPSRAADPAALPTAASPETYPPRNLYAPIFTDGDMPGPGKQINRQNYWARFVFDTVVKYRGNVRYWEIWNEPDFRPTDQSGWFGFWSGTVADYVRLLKVGYIAAKFADPQTTVLMGGMAYYAGPTFFPQALNLIKSDSMATANNHFFDITAWHWYSRSSQMYVEVMSTRNTLASNGLGGKPIWVNESGVPAWNDPFYATRNSPYPGSATLDEQASYVIQAFAYGFAAGLDRIFIFQQYDDGNAEAYGLLRNNNSPRPVYTAYQVVSQYLQSFSSAQLIRDGSVDRVVFSNTPSGKVTVLWNNSPSDVSYTLRSSAPLARRAYRVDKAGNITTLNAAAPSYVIALPRATNNNNHQYNPNDYIIGGSPFFVVEEMPGP
ncbi:MAG: hypothetical protein HY675_10505 [Chloroflexi bacterium]|nr:hypothetical protein [Chloroflexota bacterium]